MPKKYIYPVVDLFAGPGGLGEGFSSYLTSAKDQKFESVLSVENNRDAHKTLVLRHFFRSLGPKSKALSGYYEYITGKIQFYELEEKFKTEFKQAEDSVLSCTICEKEHKIIKDEINIRINKRKKWVLVGGPPCQAYSLIGRSRRKNDPDFELDHKFNLYKSYLHIIKETHPPVFVMENVKGILSSKNRGESIINQIIKEIQSIGKKNMRSLKSRSYELYSLDGQHWNGKDNDFSQFLIKSEEYGIPQARHRIFILGIRADIKYEPTPMKKCRAPFIEDMIDNLPRIRSGLSKEKDSYDSWKSAIIETINSIKSDNNHLLVKKMKGIIDVANFPRERTAKAGISKYKPFKRKDLQSWFIDKNIHSPTDHNSRSHMRSDIQRYFFSSVYAKFNKSSPKLMQFPRSLLPNHKNARLNKGAILKKQEMAFPDRFRVQLKGKVATTITSHASKDGHYYIHYDPWQCRSLTVRECARLQTFPDNFKFEGGRTSQYQQIGNAVPPMLAVKIAEVVCGVLDSMKE